MATSQYGGEQDPPLYYAVQEFPDRVEISYVFLYAYQGGQTIYALPLLLPDFDCVLHSLGQHQGDIERVVVRLAGGEVLDVGYESHGDVTWYPPDRVLWEDGTHPLVHVALNGHSCHNEHVEGDRIVEEGVPFVVDVTSNLSSTGRAWRPSDLRRLGLDAAGAPLGDQPWAAFGGRLGIQQTNSFQSATYFDGAGLGCLDWAFVKTFGTLAGLFGFLPAGVVDGNGARGPADRAWVRQPA